MTKNFFRKNKFGFLPADWVLWIVIALVAGFFFFLIVKNAMRGNI